MKLMSLVTETMLYYTSDRENMMQYADNLTRTVGNSVSLYEVLNDIQGALEAGGAEHIPLKADMPLVIVNLILKDYNMKIIDVD